MGHGPNNRGYPDQGTNKGEGIGRCIDGEVEMEINNYQTRLV